MKFGVGTPTVCASPPSGRFSPPDPVPTLGPVRGMGPTSEAKWEGWSEAEGLRRESSRPPGGRANRRSAEEQPSARRKSYRLRWQGCRLAGCGPGCEPGRRPGCGPGCGPECGPGCGPAVRAENENRAALLVRPALIFGWLHLSQQMCVLKVVISSPHRTLHTSHI